MAPILHSGKEETLNFGKEVGMKTTFGNGEMAKTTFGNVNPKTNSGKGERMLIIFGNGVMIPTTFGNVGTLTNSGKEILLTSFGNVEDLLMTPSGNEEVTWNNSGKETVMVTTHSGRGMPQTANHTSGKELQKGQVLK